MTAHTPRTEEHIHTQRSTVCCCMLLTTGMGSDNVCSTTVALEVLKMSRFELLPCISHTHRDCSHKGKSLENGCRCIVAAVLLHTSVDVVVASLSGCFCKGHQQNPLLFLIVLCAYDNKHPTYRSIYAYTHRSTVGSRR